MEYQIEVTDTFYGEANYGWVKRFTFEVPDGLSDRALVRRAKKVAGLRGRHIKDDYGDSLTLRGRSSCIIAFITPAY